MVAEAPAAPVAAAPAGDPRRLQEQVSGHALLWLVLGCACGLPPALQLLAPGWMEALPGPGYGRWFTVHANLQLYGWCTLPLLGLVLKILLPRSPAGARTAEAVLALWLFGLAVGAVSWFVGDNGSKPFVEWSGPARWAHPLGLGLAWLLLLWAQFGRTRPEAPGWLRGGLLALLATIPGALFWASGPGVYPPINPHSGGATGHSLLASTLGLIPLLALSPVLLGLPPRTGLGRWRLLGTAYLASWLVWALLPHGHASHHQLSQILGLGLTVLWVPLLHWAWRAHAWPEEMAPWRRSFLAWWALLALSGWLTFLPGMLESLKFTHALVAHAHLAMAGAVSSWGMLVLQGLAPFSPLARHLGRTGLHHTWQLGLVLQLVALAALARGEALDPGWLWSGPELWLNAAYGLRLLGGLLMLVAALNWFLPAARGLLARGPQT